MPRARPWIFAVALTLLAASPPVWAGTPIDFGSAQLGQVTTGCFTVCFGTGCSTSGTVSSLTVDPPFFVRGIREGPGSSPNLCNNTPNVTTPASLPVAIGAGRKLVFDVDLVATAVGNFQSDLGINGDPAFDLFAAVDPLTFCTPGTTALCLTGDRFKVLAKWRTALGTRGSTQVVPFGSDDSGLFYFFDEDNWEMLVKVLNTCNLNPPRFWVFAAATTNVEFTLTVTDTQSQSVKTYFNPLGNPAQPIQDTSAFATCP